MRLVFDHSDVYAYFLICTRIMAALTVAIGFGENTISQKIRLYISFFVALIFYPLLKENIHINESFVIIDFFIEVLIGFFTGFSVKFISVSLDMVGSLITNQSGLSFSSFFSNMFHEQMSHISMFLSLTGVILFFNQNMEYCFFKLLIKTYSKSNYLGNYDMIEVFITIISQGFLFAVTVGFPFITVQIVLLLSIGLVNKFTPQTQLYFISHPIQMGATFFIMVLIIVPMFNLYMEYMRNIFDMFL